MFVYAITLAISAMPLFAVATPLESRQICSTEAIECCWGTVDADSDTGTALLEIVGFAVSNVDGLIGVACSPISVVGVGVGAMCSDRPVCCQESNVGGLISIGCIPITL
ncbi:hydrophobin 1 [Trametes polyzona]|nr:hydrophobin 1 [Trametes polyzona]